MLSVERQNLTFSGAIFQPGVVGHNARIVAELNLELVAGCAATRTIISIPDINQVTDVIL